MNVDVAALLAALPTRISEIPARLAARDPQHVVLIEDERRRNAGGLVEAIGNSARQLAQAGVQGGDRVMIVSENCVAQVVLMFAVAKLDAWCLLTNARLSASEVNAIRAHAKPRVVAFTIDASKDAASHADRLNAAEAAVASNVGAWRFIVDENVSPERVETDPARQCAALIYTTGTTGAPKGVM